jgi:hypothetical protein
MRMLRTLIMKIARKSNPAIAVSFMLVGAPALGNESCGLSIQDSRLCFTKGGFTNCRPLDPKMHERLERNRCLALAVDIEGCKAVSVAPNTYVILEPFRLQYQALWLSPGVSREFYDEDRMKNESRVQRVS